MAKPCLPERMLKRSLSCQTDDYVSIIGANSLPVTRATQALSEDTNTWQSPQAGCRLGDGGVHVWRTRRHWSPAAIARFRDLLSSEERAKADAFHFEADRHRAIVGRGLLRHLLGTCLNRPPDGLQIFAGQNGKPELAPALDAAPVAFNVSHSGDWILIALAQQRAVGVDVEQMRSGIAVLEIAQRFFSEAERTGLAALPAAAREDYSLSADTQGGVHQGARRWPLVTVYCSTCPSAPPMPRDYSRRGPIPARPAGGPCAICRSARDTTPRSPPQEADGSSGNGMSTTDLSEGCVMPAQSADCKRMR